MSACLGGMNCGRSTSPSNGAIGPQAGSQAVHAVLPLEMEAAVAGDTSGDGLLRERRKPLTDKDPVPSDGSESSGNRTAAHVAVVAVHNMGCYSEDMAGY